MTGELVLAMGVGLAVVMCGVLAWWGAVKSFSRPSAGSDRENVNTESPEQ